MTYGELLEVLNRMTPQQLQQDVTIYDNDEYLGGWSLKTAGDENDVLDTGHPYLYIGGKMMNTIGYKEINLTDHQLAAHLGDRVAFVQPIGNYTIFHAKDDESALAIVEYINIENSRRILIRKEEYDAAILRNSVKN